MNRWAVRGWLLFATALSLAYAGWISYRVSRDEAQADAARAEIYPATSVAADDASDGTAPPGTASENTAKLDRPVQAFKLTDQSGQPFGTADLKGQVWVASFFFAGCPGTCRQLNFALADVARDVPEDVRLVSITCDPDNDTPETLTRYAELFSADPARWKFLTGPMATLERISRDNFQVGLQKQTHTERAFVVDRAGHVRGRFSILQPEGVAKLTALVKRLDAEP